MVPGARGVPRATLSPGTGATLSPGTGRCENLLQAGVSMFVYDVYVSYVCLHTSCLFHRPYWLHSEDNCSMVLTPQQTIAKPLYVFVSTCVICWSRSPPAAPFEWLPQGARPCRRSHERGPGGFCFVCVMKFHSGIAFAI